MIEFEGVRKQYRQRCGWRSRPLLAVDGVSLRAGDGAITALLGPNGAGKTTCLRMLCGLTLPDAGRVLVDGIDAAGDAIAARRRVGLLSDARGLYPRMTARENIVYFGALHGMSREAAEVRCEALARPLELGPLLDRRTEGFSQGERMKTALARALVHDPGNVVLDEPTNGLDVQSTRALRELLRNLRAQESSDGDGPTPRRICILFCSHLMDEVERLCDHVVLIARGRVLAGGTVGQIRDAARAGTLEEAYLRLTGAAGAAE
ncbi:MAG: ATP-binding cassette domain-containing protein [Rhodocyclaceae bacterium]|nr:MAG: ATP-binding cassette domain-containing protein [Rhodocyclaceae bacterium]